MQAKLWPTMKANWVVWPLANFIAFRFLHQDMRILYANFIGVSTLYSQEWTFTCINRQCLWGALYKLSQLLIQDLVPCRYSGARTCRWCSTTKFQRCLLLSR